jgi:hypothetical protein
MRIEIDLNLKMFPGKKRRIKIKVKNIKHIKISDKKC